jgi:predicted component of type VI protein secretion system
VRTTLKYLASESPATANAAVAVSVETTPAMSVARTGVPVRAEMAPSARGAAPSRLAATCVRDDPMSQVSPFAKSTDTNAPAASASRMPEAGP